MNKFGIYSPALGERQDYPVVLLHNAFTPENLNVQIWDGEVRAAKMRMPEMVRNFYANQRVPKPEVDIRIETDISTIITIELSFDRSMNTTIVPLDTDFNLVLSDGNVQPPGLGPNPTIEWAICQPLPPVGPVPPPKDSNRVLSVRYGLDINTVPASVDFGYNNLTDRLVDLEGRQCEAWATQQLHPDYVATTVGNTVKVDGNRTAEFKAGDLVVLHDNATFIAKTLAVDSVVDGTGTVLTFTNNVNETDPRTYAFHREDVLSVDPASSDFLKVTPPDGNEITRYQGLITSDGIRHLLSFTKSHVYKWDTSLTKWEQIFATSAVCEHWDSCQYGDNVVMTNDLDPVQYWDGSGNTKSIGWENVGGVIVNNGINIGAGAMLTKAKFVASFERYLVLGNCEVNGERYQDEIFWSALGQGVGDVNAAVWDASLPNDAGNAFVDGDGEITGGFGKYLNYLVVFKRRSIRKVWLVGGALVFNSSPLSVSVGCVSPDSVINDATGDLYWYATDKTFNSITQGTISDGISRTARDVNPEFAGLIRGVYVPEYDEICWAIPEGSDAEANNKVVIYQNGKWQIKDTPVTAFGSYERYESYTWDTLPFSSYDLWAWSSWTTSSGASDYETILAGDSAGSVFDFNGAYTDDNQSYESYFVLTTDLSDKLNLQQFKRILQVYVYVYDEQTGNITISFKRDNESAWTQAGTVSLLGQADILRQRLAVDIRGRHFLIKIEGTAPFRFIGMEFDYLQAGVR